MDPNSLLSIVLITSSPNGPSLTLRYPPNPRPSQRLYKPRKGKFKANGKESTQADSGQAGLQMRAGGDGTDDTEQEDQGDQEDIYEDPNWKPIGPAETSGKPSDQYSSYRVRRPTRRKRSPLRSITSPPRASSAQPAVTTSTEAPHILGFQLQDLTGLLAPKSSACHRKFELVVDEVVFIGHPVCVNDDGEWGVTQADGERRDSDRGRSRTAPRRALELPSVPESPAQPEVPSPSPLSASRHSSPARSSANGTADGPQSKLTLIHMVLLLDKPDPLPSAISLASASAGGPRTVSEVYDCWYREVAFKWTAAAWAEEVRCGWVSSEGKILNGVRDSAIKRQIPLRQAQDEAFASSSLAQSIKTLYHSLRSSTTAGRAEILVGEIPVEIVLPLTTAVKYNAGKPVTERLQGISAKEEWTTWGEALESVESEGSDAGRGDQNEEDRRETKQRRSETLSGKLQPWKTLLLLGDAKPLVDQGTDSKVDKATGLGLETSEFDGLDVLKPKGTVNYSWETSGRFSPAVRTFLTTCDPSVPLTEIADRLQLSLEDEIYPLARWLVYTQRAKVIAVIGPKLRNIYLPDTTSNRPDNSIPDLTSEWSRVFPTLPPFPSFMARLSSVPQAYRKFLPPNVDPALKDTYADALRWLLERDLVFQMYSYVRVVATGRTKDLARAQWLEARDKEKKQAEEKKLKEREAEREKEKLGGGERRNSDNRSIGSFRPSLVLPSGSPSVDVALSPTTLVQELLDDAEDSVILEPGRAEQKTEGRWIEAMMDGHTELDVAKFRECLPWFNGRTTMEEISYRTNMERRDLKALIATFKDHLVVFQHP